jgi:PiT family inorganic phosphate transporter
LVFTVVSPVIGMVLGLILMASIQWIFRGSSPSRVDKYFRRLQLFSAALFSLGHGTNDAQKTMGIIAGVLFTAGYVKTFDIPFWVVLMAHAAIGLGTLSGGWRIVRTMGQKITALRPVGGFSAETAGAISIIGAAWGGIPVSTTHTITGAIIGVGATKRVTAVKWGVTRRIIWAWIITIPASAAIAAGSYLVIR